MAYRNNVNKRNPKNPASSLYRRLTRIFSGPINNYRTQRPHAEKRKKLDKYGSKFRSLSGKEFQRQDYNPLTILQSQLFVNQNRAERYSDFDQMEFVPEIATALDIYAEAITDHNEFNPILKITAQNPEIREILESLYYDILGVEFNLYQWTRSMVKYGDYFLYLDIDPEEGLVNTIGLIPQEIERVEGEDKMNPNYVQFQWNSAGMTFERWQLGHFRLLGNDKYIPYGVSVLDPARRIFRQLTLMEDNMMAYRIVRAPERRVFYIDTAGINPENVEQFIQRVITKMKRNQVPDPESGRIDQRYNPYAVEEDIYIPVRGPNSATRVEPLPGGQYVGIIDDVKYLKDKLMTALKIPPNYLTSMEEGENQQTLAQKDIRFAKTILRIQRNIISELESIGRIHLAVLGHTGRDLLNFKLSLNNPSRLAELQELEQWRTRFDVASAASEGFFSQKWIANNIFGLTDDEHVKIIREMFYDRKLELEFNTIQEGPGAMGDAGADVLSGDMLDGEIDDFPPPEDEEGDKGEDDILLAEPPGKRASGGHVTPLARGKVYHPVKDDKRSMGARKRSYISKTGREKASATRRNVVPGMASLAQYTRGVYENQEKDQKDDIYFEREVRHSAINLEVQNALKLLEEAKEKNFEGIDRLGIKKDEV